MNQEIENSISRAGGGRVILKKEKIQDLWSGYGELLRCYLDNGTSLIVKYIQFQGARSKDLSHNRKLHSYQVEAQWYRHWNDYRFDGCYYPRCLAVKELDRSLLLVLEDLNPSGFPLRKHRVNAREFKACVSWLAHFHGTFLGQAPKGLWETGTYWHLETRPEEWKALRKSPLKEKASEIDRRLTESPYQTLVHGDAKLANFCFSSDGSRAAAVDFQYVGRGCAMKDLAYFAGSCYDDEECGRNEQNILDLYFSCLKEALPQYGEMEKLEENWRAMYPLAWVDFYRFYKGWGYGNWDTDSYSERLSRQVCQEIG